MKNMLTDETRSQREKLNKVFEKYKDTPGRLMPVLQEAQEIYGYLPYEIRCVGACGLAPVIMIDDEVYGNLDVDKVDAILDMYIENEKGGVSDDD